MMHPFREAEQFAKDNIKECCREFVLMFNQSVEQGGGRPIPPNGKIEELIKLCGKIPEWKGSPYDLAINMISKAAIRIVANL